MDVFNKLKSTVTSTVSQFSGVLPGNPVTREYEVTNHICSAGPGLVWKVYQGYKKSTKQEASVFVFEKRLLEKYPRENKDIILESLKHGIIQLTKLRHPQILTVQHPLEESRESLAFATEPVFSSLANILGNPENAPSPATSQIKDFKLYDIEIKYGLLQIAEGLAFLHTDVKLLHRNICPESIVINHQGAWKIFGFDFCLHGEVKQDGQCVWSSAEYSRYLPNAAQPNLDFLAPEVGLHQSNISTCSDMFSLGMVIYALYNNGKALFSYNDDWNYYCKKISELKNIQPNKFSNIPSGLQDLVKMMLQTTPELRPDAHQLQKVEFFEDIGVKTLNYLDSLFQWDKLQKSQFYKGLPPVIQNFPHRVCLHRVVPCLAKEFANASMVPFVLPCMLQIAEKCTQQEYMAHIFPHLQAAMKMSNPVQILLIFMQKMELLLKLTPQEEVKTDVLPMLYRALESDVPQIQELCLSVLPTFSGLVDYSAMKNAVLPRIKKMCIKTSHLSVRVNSLVCIGKLLENLDKWLVLDEILPFLPEIPSREPAVLMGILGIYKITLTHKKLGIPKDVIASKIVPFLMPLTIENGLTLNQFNSLFSVLKDMINRVETEHRSKIEQLSAISQQTSTISSSSSTAPPPDIFNQGASEPKTDLESIFSTLEVLKEPSPAASGPSSNLTFEEKQRLLKQQETLQKFNQQPSIITPKPAPVVAPMKNQPKDLTDVLLASNLNEMKWSNTTATSAVSPNTAVVQSGFPGLTPQTGMNSWSIQPMTQSFNTSFMGNAQPMNRGPTGFSQNLMNSSTNSMNPSMNSMNSTINTMNSCIGSMNSSIGSMNSSMNPMNAMNLSLLSPTLSSSSSLQQPAKPLSKSEINDFLS